MRNVLMQLDVIRHDDRLLLLLPLPLPALLLKMRRRVLIIRHATAHSEHC